MALVEPRAARWDLGSLISWTWRLDAIPKPCTGLHPAYHDAALGTRELTLHLRANRLLRLYISGQSGHSGRF